MNCPRCGKENVDPVYPHSCTPLALKLADWLERRTMKMLQDRQAAEELRRLHAENEALRKERDKAASENQRWIDLANTWAQEVKTEQRLSFRAQMQQFATQVEADEALLRQALEALSDIREATAQSPKVFRFESLVAKLKDRLL